MTAWLVAGLFFVSILTRIRRSRQTKWTRKFQKQVIQLTAHYPETNAEKSHVTEIECRLKKAVHSEKHTHKNRN